MRSLLAQELAGQIVDEVQPVAGSANDGSVGSLGLVIGPQQAANAARSFRSGGTCK